MNNLEYYVEFGTISQKIYRLESFCSYFLDNESKGGLILASFCKGMCSFIQLIRNLLISISASSNKNLAPTLDLILLQHVFQPYIVFLEEFTDCKEKPRQYNSFSDYENSGFSSFPRGAQLLSSLYLTLQV